MNNVAMLTETLQRLARRHGFKYENSSVYPYESRRSYVEAYLHELSHAVTLGMDLASLPTIPIDLLGREGATWDISDAINGLSALNRNKNEAESVAVELLAAEQLGIRLNRWRLFSFSHGKVNFYDCEQWRALIKRKLAAPRTARLARGLVQFIRTEMEMDKVIEWPKPNPNPVSWRAFGWQWYRRTTHFLWNVWWIPSRAARRWFMRLHGRAST